MAAKRSRRRASARTVPTNERDAAMARLGGALALLAVAKTEVESALAFFVEAAESDDDGAEREEAIDSAIEAVGAASRGLEAAKESFDEMDEDDLAAGEPWDDDVEDEEDAS
jgi:hypothetical protein